MDGHVALLHPVLPRGREIPKWPKWPKWPKCRFLARSIVNAWQIECIANKKHIEWLETLTSEH